jgi:hypothetical protein
MTPNIYPPLFPLQAKADDVANEVFSNTSTMLYGEHVNWLLRDNGVPTLPALRADPDFPQQLSAKLTSPHFIPAAIRQDELIGGGHVYTTALLYCFDYLHAGPGFKPYLDEKFASAPSAPILRSWASTLLEHPEHGRDKARVATFAASVSSLLHGHTDGRGVVQPRPLSHAIRSLAGLGIVSDSLAQLAPADEGSWKSMMELSKTAWAKTDGRWARAVIGHATLSTSSVAETGSDAEKFGQGFLTGVTLGIKPLTRSWQRTTITGQDVANWISQGACLFKSRIAGLLGVC